MSNSQQSSPAAHLLSDNSEHVYSDEELDAIEQLDAALALRIDRMQFLAKQARVVQDCDEPIHIEDVSLAIEEARKILQQDGGDLELVGIYDRTVRVRLKGACVGCPNAALDLKNVVERLIRAHAPGVQRIENVF